MKKRLLVLLLGIFFVTVQAYAQTAPKVVTGKVTDEDALSLPGVSVKVKGTTTGTTTNVDGNYSISASPGQVLVFSFLGTLSQERTIGATNTINVTLRADAQNLNEVVVTALGIKEEKKALGYAVTEVKGADIANTQRENFINALAGRVAGVEVNQTSGLPGASSSIVIRGISSLSGDNQPLFIVDGLPISNNTTATAALASSINTATSFENRGVDFTNRAADINPEDIESITVLKGPEASALYGIEAASGAVVITTKRGKAGDGRINYSFNSRFSKITSLPERQMKYDRGLNGYSDEGTEELYYFGSEFPAGTKFYDNIGNFFDNAFMQKHNITATGGSENVQYRVSSAYLNSQGYIPNTGLAQLNLSSAITAKMN